MSSTTAGVAFLASTGAMMWEMNTILGFNDNRQKVVLAKMLPIKVRKDVKIMNSALKPIRKMDNIRIGIPLKSL